MNKFVYINCTAICLLLSIGYGNAQSNGTRAPEEIQGPFVSPIPKPIVCTITYTYPEELTTNGDVQHLAGRIRSMTTSRVGATTHVQIVRIEGVTQDMWELNHQTYGKSADVKQWVLTSIDGAKQNSYLKGSEFPGTDWITADTYLGVSKFGEASCLIYMKNPPEGLDLSDTDALKRAIDKADFVAIVSVSNRCPVEVHVGGVKEVFTYASAPSVLSPPSDLTAQIAEGERVRGTSNIRPPRPY